MNQVNIKVTPEEKELYNNYLNLRRTAKDKSTDDIAKQLGKTSQALLQLSANVSKDLEMPLMYVRDHKSNQ
jgi:hypothetical protein